MINKIKTRLASEEGFTLIELLVVIIILGILVAIAVPAYLSFRGSAQDAAGKSNVRSAIPAAESYYQNAPSSYASIDGTALRAQAPGVGKLVKAGSTNSGQTYCLSDDEVTGDATHTHSYYYIGGDPSPSGGTSYANDAGMSTVTQGVCPAAFSVS